MINFKVLDSKTNLIDFKDKIFEDFLYLFYT